MFSFFLRHKFFSLLLIAGLIFWYISPEKKFGYNRSGLVVFNRTPIVFFDLFVDSQAKTFLELDIAKKENINYWFNTHLVDKDPSVSKKLIIGFGFNDTMSIPDDILRELRAIRYSIIQLPSQEAIATYNASIDSGIPAAILLKIN